MGSSWHKVLAQRFLDFFASFTFRYFAYQNYKDKKL